MQKIFPLGLALALVSLPVNSAELISVNAAGNDAGNASSFVPGERVRPFAAAGNLVVFASNASDLVATDGNGASDVFLRDRVAGDTVLVSVNAAGTDSGNGGSSGASISDDGRYVVFVSSADNLTALADSNADADLFIRDRQTGTTRLVSRNAAGDDAGDAGSYGFSMSPDAAWIVFHSDATDLADTDSNGTTDVFLYSRDADAVTLVSRQASANDSGNGPSTVDPRAAISDDGRWVVYQSRAANLVGGDANGNQDVFLYDALNGVNRRISLVPGGTAGGNGDSDNAIVSADGSRVVMRSRATDLTADDDSNGVVDFYAWERVSDSIELVTINAAGDAAGSGGAVAPDPRISADGRYLVFESSMTDLTTLADANGTDDLFLRDLVDDTTTLITTNAAADASANGRPDDPQISADGRWVYYETRATDVVATPDGNGQKDAYAWERATATTILLSVDAGGAAAADGKSEDPLPSPDGRLVRFHSNAANLVDGGGDTNGVTDVYLVALADLEQDEAEVDDSSSTAFSALTLLLLAPALLAGLRRRR